MEEVPRDCPEYDTRVTRHFLTGEELTGAELLALIDRAQQLRADRGASDALRGESVALIFEQPSTRTRVSFEVGVSELGGHPLILREGEMQLSRGESVRDTAQVLSRFVSMIGVRTVPHAVVAELAEHATVPVINMLTGDHHPCQALADLQTLRQRFGDLDGLKLAYVGDGNNVAHSLMVLGAKAGLEVAVATPPGLEPNPLVAQVAGAQAEGSGSVSLTDDPTAAVQGAAAVYVDVWVSMGDADAEQRKRLLKPYRLDEALLTGARPDAIALHCLPAHPGEEITEGVLYGGQSAVFDQAENRLHAQKALMELLAREHAQD